ncbi:MAG: ribose-5-phosphate isomerase RpiA [Planktomarina sp.]|nr:ribose-5-phosphate isomerase RpiA [Planktomarina sp.]MDT2049135.1 ribose-5-phosphate isomerase RpiA [Planktomarina sp.]
MPSNLSSSDQAKFVAAKRACEFVHNGMKLGLGTGSTAAWMVRCLAERVNKEGLKVKGVPTSIQTADLAKKLGIEVITLDSAGQLDLTIDGTDEFDDNLNLIKGAGGALLREKIVASASDKMIVIADDAKGVERLGRFPLPVEVLNFGFKSSQLLIQALLEFQDVDSSIIKTRMAGDLPFVTDEGNHILDLYLGRIGDAAALSLALNQVPGVVENGLFVKLCDVVIVGLADGTVKEKTTASN